jgi:hypothetical protein
MIVFIFVADMVGAVEVDKSLGVASPSQRTTWREKEEKWTHV